MKFRIRPTQPQAVEETPVEVSIEQHTNVPEEVIIACLLPGNKGFDNYIIRDGKQGRTAIYDVCGCRLVPEREKVSDSEQERLLRHIEEVKSRLKAAYPTAGPFHDETLDRLATLAGITEKGK